MIDLIWSFRLEKYYVAEFLNMTPRRNCCAAGYKSCFKFYSSYKQMGGFPLFLFNKMFYFKRSESIYPLMENKDLQNVCLYLTKSD